MARLSNKQRLAREIERAYRRADWLMRIKRQAYHSLARLESLAAKVADSDKSDPLAAAVLEQCRAAREEMRQSAYRGGYVPLYRLNSWLVRP